MLGGGHVGEWTCWEVGMLGWACWGVGMLGGRHVRWWA